MASQAALIRRLFAPELLAMPLTDITPLHLHREWNRLLESGGRHRRTKAPRLLSKKTVRNIPSMVSSAFTRAIKCNRHREPGDK